MQTYSYVQYLFTTLTTCPLRLECERIHRDRTFEWFGQSLAYQTLSHIVSPFLSDEYVSLVGPYQRNSYRPT